MKTKDIGILVLVKPFLEQKKKNKRMHSIISIADRERHACEYIMKMSSSRIRNVVKELDRSEIGSVTLRITNKSDHRENRAEKSQFKVPQFAIQIHCNF